MPLLLFILCIPFWSYSQLNDTLLLIKTEQYRNDSIPESIIHYAYDSQFNVIMYSEKTDYYSQAINTRSYKLDVCVKSEYDDNGHLSKQYTYYDSVLTYVVNYCYVEDKMTSSQTQEFENSILTYETRTEFTYNSMDQLIYKKTVEHHFDKNAADRDNHFSETYQYDMAGNVIEQVTYQITSTNQHNATMHALNADSLYATCEKTPEYTDSMMRKTTREYNADNQLITERLYMKQKWAETQWISYDAQGRLVKVEAQYCGDTQKTTLLDYQYVTTGNLICVQNIAQQTLTVSRTYCSDMHQRPIEESYYGPDFILYSRKTYTYNESGYLTSELEITNFGEEITRETLYTYQTVARH
jgi:hypothetical protein